MTKQSRFIVSYRDHPKDTTKFFGPFVSQRIAEEFFDELPRPMPGGQKLIKPLEILGANDVSHIRSLILSNREAV